MRLTTRRPTSLSGRPKGLRWRGAQTRGETGSPSESARPPTSTTGPPSEAPSAPAGLHVTAKISWSRAAAPTPPETLEQPCSAVLRRVRERGWAGGSGLRSGPYSSTPVACNQERTQEADAQKTNHQKTYAERHTANGKRQTSKDECQKTSVKRHSPKDTGQKAFAQKTQPETHHSDAPTSGAPAAAGLRRPALAERRAVGGLGLGRHVLEHPAPRGGGVEPLHPVVVVEEAPADRAALALRAAARVCFALHAVCFAACCATGLWHVR